MIRSVHLSDPGYPALLREIVEPPRKLYLAGTELGQQPAIAVVGARRATRYGLEVAHWIAAGLAEAGMTVVSGLAKGVDAAAHRGALTVGGNTVAVMASGLDICYPAVHRPLFDQIAAQGSLISEYDPGTRPLPFHFPVRNRIIAGMSLGVVVVEGRPDGGAMITARLAGDYGREVFAVPGPVHSPESRGPHLLLRDGARLVGSADDVLEDLGLPSRSKPPAESPALGGDEQRLMQCVGAQPELLDVLARRAGLPASTATSLLMKLELKSLVTRHPGARYSRSVAARPA